MKKIITRIILCAAFAALELSGCGGASDTATESTSIISAGTVARSIPGQTGQLITVNKVIFGIAGASITLNGEPAVQEDVKPGMQVTITGSAEGTSGVASSIEIEGELEGMVEQVDTDTRTIALLGRTVQVNEQTVFDGINSLDTLTAGQMIEVHGFPDAAGVVTATRLEVKLAAESQYISGSISNLDSVTRTFTIRTITVDYAEAELPSQPLADGLSVKVRGTYANGIMTASGIRVRHSHLYHRGHAELEGLVTDYRASAGTFTLNGQKVQLTETSTYEHGAASEITDGVKVEVKGEIHNGVLTVSSIEVDGDHGLPVHDQVTPPPLTPPAAEPPTKSAPLSGQALYDTACSGCHILGTYDTSGAAPNLSGKAVSIPGTLTGGHKGTDMNSRQIADLKAFVRQHEKNTLFQQVTY